MTEDRVVAGAVLYVADLERMVGFYESVAGLTRTGGDESYATLEAGGFQLVLLATAAAAEHAGEAPRTDVPVKLAYVVDDLDAATGRVSAHDGTLHGAEWAFADHRVQDAVDPEGNVFQLRAPA